MAGPNYYYVHVEITDDTAEAVQFKDLDFGEEYTLVDSTDPELLWLDIDTDFNVSPQLTVVSKGQGYLWINSDWFGKPGTCPIPPSARKRPAGTFSGGRRLWLQLDFEVREDAPRDEHYVDIVVANDLRGQPIRVARKAVVTAEQGRFGKSWIRRTTVVGRVVLDYTGVESTRTIDSKRLRELAERTGMSLPEPMVETPGSRRAVEEILVEADALEGAMPDRLRMKRWSERMSAFKL